MIERVKESDILNEEWEQSSSKRRRISTSSTRHEDDQRHVANPRSAFGPAAPHELHGGTARDKSIAIAATAKHASQTVAPFLTKHIPAQYAHQGMPNAGPNTIDGGPNSNTKFCYRHRPDMLCRRQADEPSMVQLQKVTTSIPCYI